MLDHTQNLFKRYLKRLRKNSYENSKLLLRGNDEDLSQFCSKRRSMKSNSLLRAFDVVQVTE